MKRFIKIIFCLLGCVLAPVIILLPSVWDYLAFYDIGEISEDYFISLVQSHAFGVCIILFIMSFFGGVFIILGTNLTRKLKQKPSLRLLEKFWPYGWALTWLTCIFLGLESNKHTISFNNHTVFFDYYSKNGLGLYKGIQRDVIKDFIKYLINKMSQASIPIADEYATRFSQVINGEIIASQQLQDTLTYFSQQNQLYGKSLKEYDNFFQSILDINWLKNEFKVFTLYNNKAQAIPQGIISGLVHDVREGMAQSMTTAEANNKIVSKYMLLLIEVSKEFCELLLREQGHYTPPPKNISSAKEVKWTFQNESATLEYDKLVNKIEEIIQLEEELEQLQEKAKEAFQKIGLDVDSGQ